MMNISILFMILSISGVVFAIDDVPCFQETKETTLSDKIARCLSNNKTDCGDISRKQDNLLKNQCGMSKTVAEIESKVDNVIQIVEAIQRKMDALGDCGNAGDAGNSGEFTEDCGLDEAYEGVASLTNQNKSIKIYCKDGWLYLAKRVDGSIDFYRNWTEYQRGFGDVDGEFFIGLDNLASVLKQKRYKLRVDLTKWSNETAYAEYSTFEVADVSQKYKLTVGGYTGTAGDAMAFHNGRYFTTYDYDNDPYSGNCAPRYNGAWWYNVCHRSNLFGVYQNNPTGKSAYGQGLCWQQYTDFYYSMKEMAMKIKPL